MTKPTYEELAAQVERLRGALENVLENLMIGIQMGSQTEKIIVLLLSETPADSLAALKDQWQTDFLSTISQKLLSAQNSGFIEIPKSVETHTDFIKWLNETQEPTND